MNFKNKTRLYGKWPQKTLHDEKLTHNLKLVMVKTLRRKRKKNIQSFNKIASL